MKKTILSAKNLSKSFAHNGTQVHVLSNVNLEIYEGDFTVIMGASGSGKSTLLYSLSGMDRATAGEILYRDRDLAKLTEKELAVLRHKDFGFVFQAIHLVGNLSLKENICVAGYLNKDKKASDIDTRAGELIRKMDIEKVCHNTPSQVSGGEAQRCAIARAVINSPALLFADEPTGALNRKNTKEVLNLFSQLNAEGQSILMVTHDIKASLRADRILYISDGDIVSELTLPKYSPEDEKNREVQVNSWLSSLEW